jgi:hypothetical protein
MRPEFLRALLEEILCEDWGAPAVKTATQKEPKNEAFQLHEHSGNFLEQLSQVSARCALFVLDGDIPC